MKEYGIWSADISDNWTRRLGDIGKPEYIDRVEIKLDDRYAKGKRFVIKTVGNASEACYIQSAKLNGKSLEKCYIDHSDIMNGGEISFRLASYPNYSWGLE